MASLGIETLPNLSSALLPNGGVARGPVSVSRERGYVEDGELLSRSIKRFHRLVRLWAGLGVKTTLFADSEEAVPFKTGPKGREQTHVDRA